MQQRDAAFEAGLDPRVAAGWKVDMTQALGRGAGMSFVLDCVRRFRETDAHTPVVLMGYLNPVEVRGAGRFAADAAAAGVDGVLLVDLPPEELGEFSDAFARHGLALILLAAPTTTDARIALLCRAAQGYLYYVSFAGVTGADQLDAGAAGERLRTIRTRSNVPVVAGFGIRDAGSAARMAREASLCRSSPFITNGVSYVSASNEEKKQMALRRNQRGKMIRSAMTAARSMNSA